MKKKIKVTIAKKIRLSSITFMILLSMISTFAFSSFLKMEAKSNEMVMEDVPTASAAKELMNSIVLQDAGVKGYLISGKEEELEPYQIGKKELEKNLEILKQHEEKSPVLKDLVTNQAVPALQKLQDYFESQISLVKEGKAEEARQKISDGKQAINEYLAVNEKIRAEVDQIIQEELKESFDVSLTAKTTILAGGGVSLLIAILFAIFLTKGIVRPISQVNRQLSEIADGGGDLTRQLTVSTNDEIRELADSFNRMIGTLRELIYQVGVSAEQVASSSEQLTASAEQTSNATAHIAETVQEVSLGSEQQVKNVNNSSLIITDMFQGVMKISESAETATASTSNAAGAARKGNEVLQSTIHQMNSIGSTINMLTNLVKGLEARSIEIGKITEVITGIAAQTNLLALNAAIEAARAGEHGRGFAVVADEVRKLAEQSGQSAQQIASLISMIQTETNQAVQTMEASRNEVAEGISIANVAGETFGQIQCSIDEVNNRMKEVSSLVQELMVGTEQVVISINTIADIANQAAAGSQSVSASVEEQLASMEEITASANSLSKMAEELQLLVGKFKV